MDSGANELSANCHSKTNYLQTGTIIVDLQTTLTNCTNANDPNKLHESQQP